MQDPVEEAVVMGLTTSLLAAAVEIVASRSHERRIVLMRVAMGVEDSAGRNPRTSTGEMRGVRTSIRRTEEKTMRTWLSTSLGEVDCRGLWMNKRRQATT